VVSSGDFIAIESGGIASGTTFVNGGADFVAGSALNTFASDWPHRCAPGSRMAGKRVTGLASI
jgi:hypothetical protein